MAIKNKPRVGDEAWFVQWCVKIGLEDEDHPEYGSNPDLDVNRTRKFATRDEAEAFARVIYPQDQRGAVAYWRSVFVAYDEYDALIYPYAGYWETQEDSEWFEGDDS